MDAQPEQPILPPPPPATQPPPTTGIPISSSPPAAAALQLVQCQAPVPWSTGLCDCCDDVENCCITCLCPCVTFGQIAEIVDRGTTSCGASGGLYALILCATGCQCLYSCFYRSKMRGQFFLEESPFADCIVHCCCESCSLCQEYRELEARGYDLHRGWQGNSEKQNGGKNLPPAVEGRMSR